MKHLLCTRNCGKPWRYSGEQDRPNLCPCRVPGLVGKTTIRQGYIGEGCSKRVGSSAVEA